jgi:hypothetical protein
MYEHRTAPLLPRPAFVRRLILHGAYAAILVTVSMIGGTWGFWFFGRQEPIDALLNAAMLLGGMGPVGELRSTPGKLFATVFALYAGLAFLGMATLLFAPVLHRAIHTFHLEESLDTPSQTKGQRRPRS